MYYVYLLLLTSGKIYTGSTGNLKRRLAEHQGGKVASTRKYRPAKLIYYEAYLYPADARDREKYLKTGDGRRNIRKQLRHLLAEENVKE